MGNKKSKPSQSADEAKGQAASPGTPGVQPYSKTPFGHNSPSKMVALDADNELRKDFKQWCKTYPAAKQQKLFHFIDFYDDVRKRKTIFMASQRCGDDVADATEVLATNGQALIDKYLTASSDRYIGALLGGSVETTDIDIKTTPSFDAIAEKALTEFERLVLSI